MSRGINTKALRELLYAKYWDERYILERNTPAGSGDTHEEEDGTKGPEGEVSDGELGSFEWFRTFEQIRGFLGEVMPPPFGDDAGTDIGDGKSKAKGSGDEDVGRGCKVLHLGCGNSTLPADLHALTYHNQLAVDFSQVVIDAMSAKYTYLSPPVTWTVMDIRAMDIPTGSIDVAIDKATLDAMLHGSLWDPPEEVRENVGRYVDEVARVLRRGGGKWVYVTFRQPHFLRPLLEREGVWEAECMVLGGVGEGIFEYFGWVMTRLGDEGEEGEDNGKRIEEEV